MFCFVEDNNNISGLVNTITEPGLKTDFQRTSWCRRLYVWVVKRIISLIIRFSV